jgi:RNA polymerase sigma factor (sigma-70 family)
MNTLKASTDLDLIESFLSGNQNAFATLVRRHQQRIYSTAMLVVRDKYIADDILQETFLKFFKVLTEGKYQHRDKLLPFLLRISHNLAIDSVRRTRSSPVITTADGKNIFDFLNIGEEFSFDGYDKNIEKERLKWAIAKLPEQHREILLLRYFADMSFKDIAELINVNQNTCLGRMRYAIKNLKKYLVPKVKRYDQNLYPK